MKYKHDKGILLSKIELILLIAAGAVVMVFLTVLVLTYFNVDIGIDLSQMGIAGRA